MAAPKNSILLALVLSACAYSGQADNVIVNNKIDGCFTFSKPHLVDATREPVMLQATIGPGNQNSDCPCKSASFKYLSYQESDGQVSELLSAHFTALGKSEVLLPVAVQKQLLFSGKSIKIDLTCSGL